MTSSCPVCGMEVDSSSAPARGEYKGNTYYFCSDECKSEFERNPEKFTTRQMGQ